MGSISQVCLSLRLFGRFAEDALRHAVKILMPPENAIRFAQVRNSAVAIAMVQRPLVRIIARVAGLPTWPSSQNSHP
jgi:hypothetical protein